MTVFGRWNHVRHEEPNRYAPLWVGRSADANTMTTLAVTGATGYVGGALLRQLRADRLERDVLQLGRSDAGYGRFIPFDLARGSATQSLPPVEYVVHCAAHIPRDQATANLAKCEGTNGAGIVHLLDAVDKNRLHRFVNVSSAHLYNDENRCVARNFYEASKLSAEVLVNAYAAYYRFEAVHLRLAYVYGPAMRHGGMFRTFIQRALKGEPINVFNGGQDRHHLIFVDDAVEAIRRALSQPRLSGTFDISTPVPVTTLEVVHTVLELTGSESRINICPQRRDPTCFDLHPEKAQDALGFEACTGLSEGVRKILQEEFGQV